MSGFLMDFFARRLFLDSGPILYQPKMLVLIPSGDDILADALDLMYDIEEYPAAIDRMVGEGCPNFNEIV